jgi:ectoine hydroxylase-related dioxygenase (phytanoyl-CoA dioxygenase family)
MISLSQIQTELSESGFCLLDGLLNGVDELQHLQNRVFQTLVGNGAVVDSQDASDFFRAPKIINPNSAISALTNDQINDSPELLALLASEPVKGIAAEVLGAKSVEYNNPRFRVQMPSFDSVSNLPWHQDVHYNTIDSPEKSVVVWVSLGSITLDMGPVSYIPGSHKMGCLTKEDFIRPNGKRIWTIPSEIIEQKRERVIIDTKPGDVVLIHMYTVHKSGENESNLTKFSAQARYHALLQ